MDKIIIPFSIFPPALLRKIAVLFMGLAQHLSPLFPFMEMNLIQAKVKISKINYLALCLAATTSFFIIFSLILGIFLAKIGKVLLAPPIIFVLCIFIFLQQIMYPKLIAARRIKGVEKNLLSALRTILIQVNAGVPLFDVLVAIASEDYGEISTEFRNAVKEINAGTPEVVALEELATKNPSIYFRRSLWQMVNGMKAGSPIEQVLKEVINALSQEQVIQIETYGSQLNPLAMFYMLIAIILPALGMTMLIVVSSLVALSNFTLQIIFWGFYGIILFFQLMFLGLIRTRRPNLLGD